MCAKRSAGRKSFFFGVRLVPSLERTALRVSLAASTRTTVASPTAGPSSVWRKVVAALHQNDSVANIELLAVNAVSDLIAKCSFLEGNISSNDKTPVTDGHVDVYGDPKHSNSRLLGRVPVQVKGRSSNSTKQMPSFSIDRDTVKFFRTNGGGVYFLVQVRKDFNNRVVFFVNLNPFRIDRMLDRDAKPASISVAFQRVPEDPAELEKIFKLALEQQKQGKTEGIDEHLLEKMRSITIHSLDAISADRPTVLNLAENDFAVTIETDGGLKLPFDMDLTIIPSSFVPRKADTEVRCGIVEYSRPAVWRSDSETMNLRLSEGLLIRARNVGDRLKATIDLTLRGSLRSQLRDLDFFLAAASGEPLVIGSVSNKLGDHSFAQEGELTTVRESIGRIVEVFEAIGANDELVEAVVWSEEDKRMLLTLHRAIVLDEEVAATSDGYGRMDISVGPFTIVTLVTAGSAPELLRVANPFDPTKRARFRLYQEGEAVTEAETINGTVYESLEVIELPAVLNLHLEGIVQAYDKLEDRNVAFALANQMVLTLLSAADSVDGARRKRLLVGARALSEWLFTDGDDKLLYKINMWQTRHRLGILTADDLAEIRTERRVVQREDEDDARLREACLSILLADFDELEIALNGMAVEQAAHLRSWPIWTLAGARGRSTPHSPSV
jgi:hypothetical protein